ncbi:MAG TPA: HK97-gp10 family putative phage morphogenesis protein [Terriglobia bacterium]|nr:HK97-gp10 family putative phage morphogenesis protein [Terriglobia bacterium]
MAEQIEVSGLKELNAALKDLELKIATKYLRDAMKVGGGVFLDSMLSLVRRSHGHDERAARGHIADDLRVRVRASKAKGLVVARIGPTKKTAWKANFLEFGTAAHVIRARKAKALFMPGGFIKSVHHPGAVAKPFMRPAFDTMYSTAIQTVKDTLARLIG